MSQQQTIANEVELSGYGLFKGTPAKVRFKPAQPDRGIVFVRPDPEQVLQVAALVDGVIVGSALVRLAEEADGREKVKAFVAELHRAVQCTGN